MAVFSLSNALSKGILLLPGCGTESRPLSRRRAPRHRGPSASLCLFHHDRHVSVALIDIGRIARDA